VLLEVSFYFMIGLMYDQKNIFHSIEVRYKNKNMVNDNSRRPKSNAHYLGLCLCLSK